MSMDELVSAIFTAMITILAIGWSETWPTQEDEHSEELPLATREYIHDKTSVDNDDDLHKIDLNTSNSHWTIHFSH